MYVLRCLFYLFIFYSQANCLYEDQIGKFDWTLRGVGKIKYADFDSFDAAEGPAKRIIVATEQNVLASLSTKNGEVLWRQVLENGTIGSISALHVEAGQASIITGSPPLLRTFDTTSSALVSEIQLQAPSKLYNLQDSLSVLLTSESVIVAGISEDGLAHTAVYDRFTGAVESQAENSEHIFTPESRCALTSTSLVCVEMSLSLVLHLPISGGKITSFSISSLGVSNKNMQSDDSAQDVALSRVHGRDDYLILKNSESNVLLKVTAKGITKLQDSGAGVSVAEDDTLYSSSQSGATLKISANDDRQPLELTSKQPQIEGPLPPVRSIAVNQYGRKSFCVFIILEDDSLHLLDISGTVWSREESLSDILAVEFVDLPVHSSSVSMHEQLHSKNILSNLLQRIVAQTTEVLLSIAEVVEGSLGSSGDQSKADSILVRDEFNLHKLVVVATASGKILALDNWTGRVVWSSYLPEVRPLPQGKMLLFLQRTVSHFPLPPLMTLVAMQKDNSNGAVYSFNPTSGESVHDGVVLLKEKTLQASMLSQHDSSFVKPVIVVTKSLSVKVFPSVSGEQVVLKHKEALFITTRNNTHLSGYSLVFSEENDLKLTPVWSGSFPPGRITAVYPKRSNDKLHSAGRVMADRSVLYKYSNPNLAVVVTQGYDHINKNVLSIHLVDLVSGNVIDWISHQRASGPIHVMHSENWIIYSYHNDKMRRHELQSIELFEGRLQANATAFSSFANLRQPPIVEKQAYIIPQGIQAVTHTVTEKSITNRFLLMALQNGGIAQVAKWLVDPRRPITNTGPHEEGLVPYAPEIPIPTTEIISYNLTFPRVRGIYTGPTGLESTCIVFTYGLDLFFTRVFPSKMYDILKEDFDYNLILAVLGSLLTAAIVTRKMAQRKALNNLWK